MEKTLIKPSCHLVGEDSNIFHLISLAKAALINAGYKDKATEMVFKVVTTEDYHMALSVIGEYVEIK